MCTNGAGLWTQRYGGLGNVGMDTAHAKVEHRPRLFSCHVRSKYQFIIGLPQRAHHAHQKPVAWMPLDSIGEIYADWMLSTDSLPFLVNVVHPRPTTWEAILQAIGDALGMKLCVVPLGEWIKRLENRATDASLKELEHLVCFHTTSASRIKFLPARSENIGIPSNS